MASSWDTIETPFSAAFASGKPTRTPADQSGKSCERASHKDYYGHEDHLRKLDVLSFVDVV
jgi:hypothetical protein